MRILMVTLFCCISATLATYKAASPTASPVSVGCGGDPNAESKSCGDPCPITCENKGTGGPLFCSAICILNGCGCKTGFVKDVNGKCIRPEACPASPTASPTASPVSVGCGGDPNAESKSCGDPCPITCENKGTGGPLFCSAICILNGCGCKTGFVKDVNGKCIRPEACPASPTASPTASPVLVGCGGDPNAESKPCGDPCPITCENKDAGGPRICPAICIPNGCGCKTGFVKDVNGKCIRPEACPSVGCGGDSNAESKPCGDPCPITCENKDAGGPRICPAICIPNGCGCKTGFVKDVNGKCIRPEACPCPDPNAEFRTCPNPCPPTCANLATFGKTPCTKMCLATGCTCRKGYVFDANRKCITPDKCPKI